MMKRRKRKKNYKCITNFSEIFHGFTNDSYLIVEISIIKHPTRSKSYEAFIFDAL